MAAAAAAGTSATRRPRGTASTYRRRPTTSISVPLYLSVAVARGSPIDRRWWVVSFVLGRDEAPLAAVKNSGATGRVWCRGLPPFPRRQFGVLAQLLMAKLAAARQFSLDLGCLLSGGRKPTMMGWVAARSAHGPAQAKRNRAQQRKKENGKNVRRARI